MKFLFKFAFYTIIFCLVIVGIVSLVQNKQMLRDTLAQLHIAADLDTKEDQQTKLQVKETIVDYLQPVVDKFPSKEEALSYLRNNIQELRQFANGVLDKLVVSDRGIVTVGPQA